MYVEVYNEKEFFALAALNGAKVVFYHVRKPVIFSSKGDKDYITISVLYELASVGSDNIAYFFTKCLDKKQKKTDEGKEYYDLLISKTREDLKKALAEKIKKEGFGAIEGKIGV